jgi:hypothetical protein
MIEAFQSIAAAIEAGDVEVLRCKRIWLASVLRELPGTLWADLAGDGLAQVDAILQSNG